jgi:hypothetical protein
MSIGISLQVSGDREGEMAVGGAGFAEQQTDEQQADEQQAD